MGRMRNRSYLTLVVLALWFNALTVAQGRGRGRKKRWKSMMPTKGPAAPREASVVKFQYATELNASSFVDKVELVANVTQTPPYFPFVMFHVSWCKHCQHTLPEFEKAAEMISKATEEGKLKGLAAEVKFFVLQCDQSLESRAHCDKHPGGVPSLKLFRDNRSLQFPPRGNRYAKNIAEWSANVSRPAVLQVETTQHLEKLQGIGAVFMLSADVAKQPTIFNTWVDLAFELIHDAVFSIVPVNSEVSKLLPPAQSVGVQGFGIDALPFESAMTEDALKTWVRFNQWQAPVFLTPEITIKLLRTKLQVVVFAFKYGHRYKRTGDREAEAAALDRFRAKASELRKDSKYVVACIDATIRENADFLARVFPVAAVPSIFVFAGNSQVEFLYWEDPLLADPSNVTVQLLEDLIANPWARHDSSKQSSIKGYAKRAYRFGTGSVLGVIIMVVVPCVLIAFCGLCVRELCAADDFVIPQERRTVQKPVHAEKDGQKDKKND